MANAEVGTAYVTIMPKMDNGFADSITGALGKTGGEGGKLFGDGMLGSFAGMASKIIAALGLVEVAKKIGEVGKQALDAYASYEQLSGGVNKLFGDAASTVEQNASRAFETAGMSANEYMETVTGFSASLIQSVGGDTERAAEQADKAIRDMSDNANTFGTDISSIQNAYQGFAKGNFTMLDNLKLGYGGTKEEMERLLADAEAISGVHYDLDNYSDVVDAIHTIQEEQHIAGTTAMEAAGTVEGSTSMMKASWSNFLTELGKEDADLDRVTQELVDSVVTAATNAVKVLGRIVMNAVKAFPGMLKGFYKAVKSALGPWLAQLKARLSQAWTQIKNTAVKAWAAVKAAIAQKWNEIKSEVAKKVDEIKSSIAQKWEAIKKTVSDKVTAIKTAVTNGWNNIKTAVSNAVNSIKTNVTNVWNTIKTTVTNVVNGIKTTVTNTWNGITSAVTTAVNNAKSAVTNGWNNIKSNVTNVVNGIKSTVTNVWNGIKSSVSGAVSGIQSAVSNGFNAVKNTASNVMSGVRSTVSSIWEGIKSAVSSAANAVRDKVSGAFSGLSSTLSGIWNGIKNAITTPINAAKDAVSGAIDRICSIVNGAHLSLPHIKLPHFHVNGGSVPWGIGGKGTPPSISIDWYAKGGIVSSPSLIGVGEAGPELVLPQRGGLMNSFAHAVAAQVGGGVTITGNTFVVRRDSDIEAIGRAINQQAERQRRGRL